MALTLDPQAPWTWIGLTLLAVIGMLYLWWWMRGRWEVLADEPRVRLIVAGLSGVAGAFFALALLNPVSVVMPQTGHDIMHVSVVIDVSDSTIRQGGWDAIRPYLRNVLADGMASLTAAQRAAGSASLLTVAGDVSETTFLLDQLIARFDQLTTEQFAAGTGSRIGAAVEQAIAQVRRGGGRGMIVLATDGFDTDEALLDAAQRATQSGIPIWVVPFGSSGPARGLSAVYLPPEAEEGEPILLRALIANDLDAPLDVSLHVAQYVDTADAPPLTASGALAIPGGSYVSVREAILFSGVGLRPLDITIQAANAPVSPPRRLYTHVARPLRVLAVGGDFGWVAAIRPGFARIDQVRAADFSTVPDLTAYDVVVLNAVSGAQFAPSDLERLANAVEMQAVGLFVVNGDHGTSPPEAVTVLRSLEETALGPLLPISMLPRPFTPEPPPRQVVMLLDVSGSMAGQGLQKEKEMAAHIINNLMRPVDTLDIILFDTNPFQLVTNRQMDDAGKRAAIDSLSRIGIGGGTDPTSALRLIQGRSFTECGLIIMSDGGFNGTRLAQVRPDCRITAMEIGRSSLSLGSGLTQLADPIAIPYTFNPANLVVPFFEREERERFFEPGVFPLISMEQLTGFSAVHVPTVEIDGSAIAYVCDATIPDDDPGCAGKRSRDGALTYAVRPKWIDPMLVFSTAGLGSVGVFAGKWDSAWRSEVSDAPAIETWIERVTAYAARDRYRFAVEEAGNLLRVTLSLKSTDAGLPLVTMVTAALHWNGETFPVMVRPQPDAPSTFIIEGNIPRRVGVSLGVLELSEVGPDALEQTQRVPILIAPALGVAGRSEEAGTYGINVGLLELVANMTRGVYEPLKLGWFQTPPEAARVVTSYWDILLVLAGLSYLAAVFVRRLWG